MADKRNAIQPDPISLTTHHLHIGFNDQVLGSGTGFIYKKEGVFYLITNWHVVSGRDPKTKKCISETAAIPNIISTMFRKIEDPGSCHRENISLYGDEDMTEPEWLEHPQFKNKVDIVAIPLPPELVAKYKLFPINDVQFDKYKEEVADEAFVIGYPFSELTYIQLPIWKKASIASEPDVNLDQLPKFYIDTATRSGLSGSPVIMQRIGIHGVINNEWKPDSSIGRIRNFIGIYSGRVGKDEFKAQLGIVWKARVIDEIISK